MAQIQYALLAIFGLKDSIGEDEDNTGYLQYNTLNILVLCHSDVFNMRQDIYICTYI